MRRDRVVGTRGFVKTFGWINADGDTLRDTFAVTDAILHVSNQSALLVIQHGAVVTNHRTDTPVEAKGRLLDRATLRF